MQGFEGNGVSFSGWLISEEDRARLLVAFPPRYPDVICHHITYQFGGEIAPPTARLVVIGVADDGIGVQALVVEVDGALSRPDGGMYHITHSIDRAAGAKPVHSNQVISEHGFVRNEPIEISSEPKVFSNSKKDAKG